MDVGLSTLKSELHYDRWLGRKWINMSIHTQNIFILTFLEYEVWPGGTKSMSLPESCCVRIPSFKSTGTRVCLHKISFLDFFFVAPQKKNIGRGVAI